MISLDSIVVGDRPEHPVNPLPRTAAFGEFQRDIGGRCVEQPVVADATLVASYRFLTT